MMKQEIERMVSVVGLRPVIYMHVYTMSARFARSWMKARVIG